MAMDDAGQVYDPYGGQQDFRSTGFYVMFPMPLLKIHCVYCVLPVLLPVIHIAGFKIADETLELMRKLADSGELECR